MRPANTNCTTCRFWDEGTLIQGQRAGLCRKRAADTIQPIKIVDVEGRGLLDELLADGDVDDQVATAVRTWLSKNLPRLRTAPRTILRCVWGLTFAPDWCGDHQRWSQDP